MSETLNTYSEKSKQKGLSINVINNEYLKLDNYRKKYGIDEETNLLILRHNEEKQDLINKYLYYKQNILTETKTGFDNLKKEIIKIPNDYIGTLEDWQKLPNELKEYIKNGGTEVSLDPIDLAIGGALGKKLFLSIKKNGEAVLKMQGKELIKVDLVKEGGNIIKILKNTGDDLVYFTKRFLENIFEPDFITPEGFNFKDFDFDKQEDKEDNTPFKESVKNNISNNLKAKEFDLTDILDQKGVYSLDKIKYLKPIEAIKLIDRFGDSIDINYLIDHQDRIDNMLDITESICDYIDNNIDILKKLDRRKLDDLKYNFNVLRKNLGNLGINNDLDKKTVSNILEVYNDTILPINYKLDSSLLPKQ